MVQFLRLIILSQNVFYYSTSRGVVNRGIINIDIKVYPVSALSSKIR